MQDDLQTDLNGGTLPAIRLTVERCHAGIRIDSFLSRSLRNYTSWRLMRLVDAGAVRINDTRAVWDQRVSEGQEISVRLLEPPDKLLEPMDADLNVVYEDPWLLVVDKPVGLVAHPVGDFQDGTLSNVIQSHLNGQTWAPGLLRPGIVHRLDRMTSGLMVTAKDQRSHRELSADFQEGRMSKSYLALVEGRPEFELQVIERPIGQRPGGRTVLMSAADDALHARSARTDVQVLQRMRRVSLVSCRLHSGRNHQIRVHLAHLGHPVVGDEFYGPFGSLKAGCQPTAERTDQRHALHASQLAFRHPILGVTLSFQSRPPADFWQLLVERTEITCDIPETP